MQDFYFLTPGLYTPAGNHPRHLSISVATFFTGRHRQPSHWMQSLMWVHYLALSQRPLVSQISQHVLEWMTEKIIALLTPSDKVWLKSADGCLAEKQETRIQWRSTLTSDLFKDTQMEPLLSHWKHKSGCKYISQHIQYMQYKKMKQLQFFHNKQHTLEAITRRPLIPSRI